jgi:hypothetical protein
MKKIVRSLAVATATASMLSACTWDQFKSDVRVATTDIVAVAGKIDAGIALAAQEVGPACEIVGAMTALAKLTVSSGLVKGDPIVTAAIGVGTALSSNPQCVAALNGTPVTNPIAISTNIITFAADVRAVTQGRVTATDAATSKSPVVAAARRSVIVAAAKRRHRD